MVIKLIGMFGEGKEGTSTKPIISTPFNPVHLAHVGFDAEAGIFTVYHLIGIARSLGKTHQGLWNNEARSGKECPSDNRCDWIHV